VIGTRLCRGGALALIMLATACSSTMSPDQGQRREPTAPKILTIGIQGELPDFYGFGGIRGRGITEVPPIALDTLVVQNAGGEWHPLLAAEQLSFELGTWRVNPDGSMDTSWKIRPNVKWHDGTPFTAADMVFTVAVRKDPDVGARNFGRLDLVASATAPDPLTFAIHWSAPYVDANQALDLEPMPSHLLEDTYVDQKEQFANSPFLSTQFVGQGPYQLLEWQRGSHMVFTRFEDYYQGRPPLDRVIVRSLGDPNTMVASILAGAVDYLPTGVGIDAAVDVQRQWAGTGNVVRFDLAQTFQHVEVQFRPEVARPREGLTNLTVRRALYHAIDRQAMTEVATLGLGPVADSWIPPNSGLRAALEPLIPRYGYDQSRAMQLLAGVGWVRGADGTLVHSTSGERFETGLMGTPQLMSIVAGQWKEIGVQASEAVMSPVLSVDREIGASYTGGYATTAPTSQFHSGKRLYGGRSARRPPGGLGRIDPATAMPRLIGCSIGRPRRSTRRSGRPYSASSSRHSSPTSQCCRCSGESLQSYS